jgi:hypothetical protein
MAARLGYIGLVMALGPTPAPPADSVGIGDMPAPLRRTAECMLGVTKAAPGVTAPRLGVSNDKSLNRLQPIWTHPYLQYTYSYKDGRSSEIRFDAQIYDVAGIKHYPFFTALSGLGLAPPDWGTGELAKLWRTQCHAEIVVSYR